MIEGFRVFCRVWRQMEGLAWEEGGLISGMERLGDRRMGMIGGEIGAGNVPAVDLWLSEEEVEKGDEDGAKG